MFLRQPVPGSPRPDRPDRPDRLEAIAGSKGCLPFISPTPVLKRRCDEVAKKCSVSPFGLDVGFYFRWRLGFFALNQDPKA